ncbi:hypothetical protein ABFK29_09450 [Sagittula stellata E-37]|uniref:Uncharacterized protein n=2 Tax=Sagittula stellata TaxID=52603 RepID=A3K9Z6_SAGS3|nr:hypothetical protein SSE37_25063 [Sagittula stellata E-37]
MMQRLWAWACLLATLAFIASYFVVPDFNGFTADQFPKIIEEPPVQPSGYAFSIWGLIYVWLLVAAIFGAIRRSDDEDWGPMRPWLSLSLALGSTWLPVASVSPLASTVLIFLMLAAALRALFRVGDTDRWLQQAPVAIYSGWLTAAAFVALGVVLGGYDVFSPTISALISLTLALAVSLIVQFRLHRAPEYGITVIWALIGVIFQNSQPFNAAVAGLALLGIVAILSLRATDTE